MNDTATRTRQPWLTWLSGICRFGLAAVWIVSGVSKIGDQLAMKQSVAAYELFSPKAVIFIALALPPAEIALGVALLIGLLLRTTGVVSAVLLVAFIAGIASAWARGLSIDCGCFGTGGDNPDVNGWTYLSEILRDTAFLAMAIVVVRWPMRRWSLPGLA